MSNYVDAVVAYVVLLLLCSTHILEYKFTEVRVAATFMYPAYKHSGAASNCYLLMCSTHLMRIQQPSIYCYYMILLTYHQQKNVYPQAHQAHEIYFLDILNESYYSYC